MNGKDRDIVVILGIPFDNIDMDETISRIEEFVLEGFPHYAVSANVDFVVNAMADKELQEIVRLADVILADGTPLGWAARLVGHPFKQQIAGSDLVRALTALAARKGWRVLFLDGKSGAADEAIRRLKARHSGLKIGYFPIGSKPLLEMGNAKILAKIRDFAPQILFVSMGAGKSEKWIRMHADMLGVPVCLGVGAAVDDIAGQVKGASPWIRGAGLEWLWSIFQEPGRLVARCLYDLPVFAFALLRQWRAAHARQHSPAASDPPAVLRRTDGVKVLKSGSRLDASAVSSLVAAGGAALSQKQPVVLDLSAASFVDSAGLGGLVGLEKQARSRKLAMALAAPQPQVAALIKLARLESFFHIHDGLGEAVAFVRGQKAGLNLAPVLAGKRLVVPLEGRLDAANSRIMQDELFRLAHRDQGWSSMVLDLSRLEFIDSSGLGVLILLNKKLGHAKMELVLKGVRGEPLEAFKMARLGSYFKIA